MAKVYEITVTYTLRKTLTIEADSFEEACDEAFDSELPGIDDVESDAELVDDSFQIDPDTNKEPVQIVR